MGLDIGIVATFLTAVFAAYLGFRHQQRLRAFELFLGRRESTLAAMAVEIERLYGILDELEAGGGPSFKNYGRRAFRHNLILFHRMKGAAFGPTADALIDTFYAVANEPILATEPLADPGAWLHRLLNCPSTAHAFGHAELSREMRRLSLSIPRRVYEEAQRRFAERRDMRLARKTVDRADRADRKAVQDDF